MANALTIFEAGVPAHIAAAMAAEGSGNIVARATVNALTFDNSGFAISLDGKKTKLMKTNADGEEEAVQIFSMVVLNYAKDRGREYYSKPYDPKNPAIPDCWSEDSKTPHPNCATPVAKTCAICPNSKKGSAITANNDQAVACGQFQKLAVIPASKIGQFPPLRLRLKITSIYDKRDQEKHPGWYAWQQYLDLLVSKGINNTAYLPTKVKFDKNVSYAKLLFAPGKDWLDEDTMVVVKEMQESPETQAVLDATYDGTQSKTGNKPLPEDEEEVEVAAAQPVQARAVAATGAGISIKAKAAQEAAAQAAQSAARAAPKTPAQETEEEDDGEIVLRGEDEDATVVTPVATTAKASAAAANAAIAVKAAQKAAQARQNPVTDDDDDATSMPPAKAAKGAAPAKANGKAAPAAAPKGTLQAPAEVADLVQDWDD